MREKIQTKDKLLLTIEEAAEYSHIGAKKLRAMTDEPDCNFVLRKGAYILIKRVLFEKYILSKDVI